MQAAREYRQGRSRNPDSFYTIRGVGILLNPSTPNILSAAREWRTDASFFGFDTLPTLQEPSQISLLFSHTLLWALSRTLRD